MSTWVNNVKVKIYVNEKVMGSKVKVAVYINKKEMYVDNDIKAFVNVGYRRQMFTIHTQQLLVWLHLLQNSYMFQCT